MVLQTYVTHIMGKKESQVMRRVKSSRTMLKEIVKRQFKFIGLSRGKEICVIL